MSILLHVRNHTDGGGGGITPEITTTFETSFNTSRIFPRSCINPPHVSLSPSGPFQLFVIGTLLIINFHTTPLSSAFFAHPSKSPNCFSPNIVFPSLSSAKLLDRYRRVSRKKKLVSP